MNSLDNLYGAEAKKQFIETLPINEADRAVVYFQEFEYAEKGHDMHLFQMDAATLIGTVQMSMIAPSNMPTAQSIKTFLVKYFKWAKNNGLVNKTNPLAKVHAIEFCADWAVANRYVKSIEALTELLESHLFFTSTNGKWSMLMLGLLLVYDGVDETQVASLKYSDIDYETRTISTDDVHVVLSELTLDYIEKMHQWKVIDMPVTKVYRTVSIAGNEYIIPRVPQCIKPLVGNRFMKFVSQYKMLQSKSSELMNAEWLTVESVRLSGKFYRVFARLEDNNFDSQTQHVYELWKTMHYPEIV